MILVFDTETTGMWKKRLPSGAPEQPRVVQLGAILVDPVDRSEVMRLDMIVRQETYPEDYDNAAAIHGITREKNQLLGVNESAAMDLFFDMVDMADLLVAHNIQYDVNVLDSTAKILSGKPDYAPFAGKAQFCTMKAAIPVCKFPNKNGFGSYGWPKLEDAIRKLIEREPTAAHSAIGDVIDCRDLFFYLQDLIAQRQADAAAA